MTVKDRAIQALQDLPESADSQAVSERISFILAVDEGLKQAKESRTLSETEVRQRLANWLIE